MMSNKLTPEQRQIRLVKERDWQNLVIQLATSRGWKYYHAPDNKPVNGRIQRVVPGFPDLVLVKNGRLIFAELKREKGILSPEQADWLATLRACGNECFIWRPSHLSQVVDILEGRKPAKPFTE